VNENVTPIGKNSEQEGYMDEGQAPIERIEFDEEQKEGLRALGIADGAEAKFRPILRIWRAILEPISEERGRKVTPQWAVKIRQTYGVPFKDMDAYSDMFYSRLEELLKILKDEIATDVECESYDNAEDDAIENRLHYKRVLTAWQVRFVQWEVAWQVTADDAEIHRMLFGETGLTQHLENIKLEWTESDQEDLVEALREAADGNDDMLRGGTGE